MGKSVLEPFFRVVELWFGELFKEGESAHSFLILIWYVVFSIYLDFGLFLGGKPEDIVI